MPNQTYYKIPKILYSTITAIPIKVVYLLGAIVVVTVVVVAGAADVVGTGAAVVVVAAAVVVVVVDVVVVLPGCPATHTLPLHFDCRNVVQSSFVEQPCPTS